MTAARAHVHNRDVVVVGASLGGVDALQRLVSELPADLPATVLVVQHVHAAYKSPLPDLLSARGPMRAHHALHGEALKHGEIVVAPPDNHLVVRQGSVHVVRGPKENGHRPSVDALFRSAAAAYGPRVIGVVLTGHQDCGTAGLLSIKAHGGIAVVQDPKDAVAPDMPASALAHVDVDHVVRLDDVASLVARLVHEKAPAKHAHVDAVIDVLDGEKRGAPSVIVCPICDGALTEVDVNGFTQFRCHVGHAFSLESVVAEQAEQVERALWASVRSLEEASTLAGRLASRASGALKTSFEERERTQRQHADTVRRVLLAGHPLEPRDAPVVAAATTSSTTRRSSALSSASSSSSSRRKKG